MRKNVNIMKSQFLLNVFTLMSVLFFAACSTEEFAGKKNNDSFSKAEIYYYYDEFVPGVGSYGIALYDDKDNGSLTELYLDFASDYFEDALKATPANGVYTFSDSFAENTFNSDYSGYIKKDYKGEVRLDVTGGRFSLSRSGSNYTLHYDVVLEDGSPLKGSYTGKITGLYDATIASDMEVDFNTMEDKWVEVVKDGNGVWNVIMTGEPGSGSKAGGEIGVVLMINGEGSSSISLPEGNFPMAAQSKQGVERTTEPASAYDKKIYGCHFTHSGGDISWAVPGEGFVDIQKSDKEYTISFSFKDHNGHTVSGIYNGKIDVVWRTHNDAKGKKSQAIHSSQEIGVRQH